MEMRVTENLTCSVNAEGREDVNDLLSKSPETLIFYLSDLCSRSHYTSSDHLLINWLAFIKQPL